MTNTKLFKELAANIRSQAELDAVLDQIKDETQRDLVFFKLIPLLSFTPKDKEISNEGSELCGVRETQDGSQEEGFEGAGASSLD